MRTPSDASATFGIQRLLAARLEARAARLLAMQARRGVEMAPEGLAGVPAAQAVWSAERILTRAQQRVADAARQVDLLA